MKIRLIAFTEKGCQLARTLGKALDGNVVRCGKEATLSDWTKEAFSCADALIFVGAAGIAVRAVAPHVKSKVQDPAVVVVDEGGNFAIPILSGHLGGANALARKIGKLCGAVPVITTATDVNQVFAVDEWAKKQGCRIVNPEKIKQVSGRLLSGEPVRVKSEWPIEGKLPQGLVLTRGTCDVRVDIREEANEEGALLVVPKAAVLGVGCKKGTAGEVLEKALDAVLQKAGIRKEAVGLVCSIDLKKDEPGLLSFCASHAFAFRTFSAEALNELDGTFTGSDFVKQVTGVDNVCERSALAGSGKQGILSVKKYAGNGVTMALALCPFPMDWSFHYE